jgi:hypothetical protein
MIFPFHSSSNKQQDNIIARGKLIDGMALLTTITRTRTSTLEKLVSIRSTLTRYQRDDSSKLLLSTTSRYNYSSNDDDDDDSQVIRYLHLGPSGDAWTGDSLFAAKHLQPDYVRSIPLCGFNNTAEETLLEVLDENEDWTREIYDTQTLPDDLKKRLAEEPFRRPSSM